MTTSAVFLTLLMMAIAGSCTDKTTEATCGGGCVWTNRTGADSGTCGGFGCGGTPSCVSAEQSACYANAGCNWIVASPAKCEGSAMCEAQTAKASCTAIGCNYGEVGSASCVGAPTTCDGTSDDNCKLTGCIWTPANVPAHCDGWAPVTCGGVNSEAGCNAIEFCEWKPPTPGVCSLAEGVTCDTFNNLEAELGPQAAILGPLDCALAGCTYSGSLGTCTGSKTITCAGASSEGCSSIGCSGGSKVACFVPTSCSFISYMGSNANEICTAAGCTWNNGGCSGTPKVTSETCSSTSTDNCGSVGCVMDYVPECVVPPVCNYLNGDSSGCAAAGCTWNAADSTCSGTVRASLTEEDCTGKSSPSCSEAGCFFNSRTFECSGTPNITSCSQMEFGGLYCEGVGCTTTGGSEGSCSGTIIDTSATATDWTSCMALGFGHEWKSGDPGACEQKPGSDPANKACTDFTASGNEICYLVGCTWESAVAQGCSGTPQVMNYGTTCGTLTTEGQGTCVGNGCTWIPSGGNACTGTATKTCEEQAGESACSSIGGCTYTPAIADSKCEGTNTGLCVGSTLSTCTGVFGCSFTPACTALTTGDACTTGGCTWTQEGTCADEGKGKKPSSAVVSYVPALLVLLLALLI